MKQITNADDKEHKETEVNSQIINNKRDNHQMRIHDLHLVILYVCILNKTITNFFNVLTDKFRIAIHFQIPVFIFSLMIM